MLSIYNFVFFFKQKTAYEMRISDWSSDVCSSDLRIHRHARSTPSMRAPMVPTGIGPAICSWISDHGREDPPSAIPAETGKRPPREIGRASCRERVCQYGEISVVAV